MSSWIRAARWVKDNHQFRLIHKPTGNLVTRKKAGYYLSLDEIVNGETCGATLEQIADAEKKLSRTDCIILDAFTASMLVTIYDSLSPIHQQKFDGMSIIEAVDVGWRCVKYCKIPKATV